MWLIHLSALAASKVMHYDIENRDQDTIPYSCDRSHEIFIVHAPIALTISYRNACMPSREAVLAFYNGIWYKAVKRD